jgi:hypothetical protein
MTGDRAAQLRDAFDRGFALPHAAGSGARVELLRLRVGDAAFAVALVEVASLHVDLDVVALPAADPALRGVAAIRGAVVAVYDLRALLGVAAAAHPRWVVISRGGDGFAFDGFAGHVRVAALPPSGGAVVLDGRPHPLIELATLRGRKER